MKKTTILFCLLLSFSAFGKDQASSGPTRKPSADYVVITVTGNPAKLMYDSMTDVGVVPLTGYTFKTGTEASCGSYDDGSYKCQFSVKADGTLLNVNGSIPPKSGQ